MSSFRVRFLAALTVAGAILFASAPAASALVASAASAFASAASAAQPPEPIDINTATKEELTELPRIGEVTAERIVAWREENGPFSSTEELMNIQGIGERVFERIRPHVTVGEPPESAGAPAGRRPSPLPSGTRSVRAANPR